MVSCKLCSSRCVYRLARQGLHEPNALCTSLNSYFFRLGVYLTELLWQSAVIREQILVVVFGKMFVSALKLLVINPGDTGCPRCQ